MAQKCATVSCKTTFTAIYRPHGSPSGLFYQRVLNRQDVPLIKSRFYVAYRVHGNEWATLEPGEYFEEYAGLDYFPQGNYGPVWVEVVTL